MARGGAYDKLVLKTLAKYRSLSTSKSLSAAEKSSLIRAISRRSPPSAMDPQGNSNTVSSDAKTQAGDMKSQRAAATPRPGWRPYRDRWNSKTASRDTASGANNAIETGRSRENIASADTQISRRRRPRRKNQRMSERQSHLQTGYNNAQSDRSLSPRQDRFLSQAHQSPAVPNLVPALDGNGFPAFPMLNPFPVFGGFPMPMDASVGLGYPSSFFPQSMPGQLLPHPLDHTVLNPAFFPLLNGANPMAPIPFLSPAAPMNFGLQSQPAPESILNALDPMGSSTSANIAGEVASLVPEQPPLASAVTSREQPAKLPRPSATKKYLHQSSLSPQLSSSPQPLLIILDLNGTLIYRRRRAFPPQFARRAGLDDFLNTIVDKYKVMIWSSSQPETVDAVCKKLFLNEQRQRLVAEWGRDKFNLSASQYNAKIQVYKTLETVWSDPQIQASYPDKTNKNTTVKAKKGAKRARNWDQTNTILIDDSKLKAISEPYNLLEIPEFTNAPGIDESTLFPKVLQRLDILSRCDDVSKMLHLWDSTAKSPSGAEPATSILDLDISAFIDPKDDDVTATQTGTNADATEHSNPNGVIDIAEARKERRKARKQEKKAARRAAAVVATISIVHGNVQNQSLNANKSPAEPKTEDSKENMPPPRSPSASPSPATEPETNLPPPHEGETELERSPSPVSVQSENFLLDRLEESLNV